MGYADGFFRGWHWQIFIVIAVACAQNWMAGRRVVLSSGKMMGIISSSDHHTKKDQDISMYTILHDLETDHYEQQTS